VIVAIPSEEASPTSAALTSEPTPDSSEFMIPLEALVGLLVVVAVVAYIVTYLQGMAAVDRYRAGFVLKECPVCQQGRLSVETRQERFLGIPRARRTIHCDHCRSVLRETGYRLWRYAVDPAENAPMFERYNGRVLDEDTLVKLAENPLDAAAAPRPRPPFEPPTFVDHDDG
jgi:hypothetical protein